MATLIIDFGASRIKWCVQGQSYSTPAPQDDNGFIPAGAHAAALKAIINGAKAFQSIDIEEIFMCTEMGGFVIAEENDEPVTPYVSWRAGKIGDLLNQLDEQEKLPDNASFFTLPEWICVASGGRVENACEHHVHNFGFVKQYYALKTFPSKIIGKGTFEHRNRQIPVTFIGDTQAAALGADLNVKDLLINIGTGSQVLRFGKGLPFIPYCDLSAITHIPAGRALRVFERFIPDMWKIMKELTFEEILDASEEIDLNVFETARGYVDGGAIFRITEKTTQESLCAGIVKSMVKNYKEAVEELDSEGFCSNVKLSGGIPVRIPAMKDVISEALQLPVSAIKEESTLRGLDMLKNI